MPGISSLPPVLTLMNSLLVGSFQMHKTTEQNRADGSHPRLLKALMVFVVMIFNISNSPLETTCLPSTKQHKLGETSQVPRPTSGQHALSAVRLHQFLWASRYVVLS